MRIAILIATYNGERYVEEQIRSLMAQSHKDFRVFVRDDNSSDSTRTIVSKFAQLDTRIELLPEHDNLGVTQNFFRLLETAGSDFDAYAFCDQDDHWLPDKLADSVHALKKKDAGTPLLYFARLAIVNERLEPLGFSPAPEVLTFWNAVAQNVVTGCTAVINRSARELILASHYRDSRIWSHDWWLYLVISRFGELIYNPKAGILYRQHEQNLMGSKQNRFAQFFHRLSSASAEKLDARRPSQLIRVFLEAFEGHLAPDERHFLRRACDPELGLWARLSGVFDKKWVRQSKTDTLILKLRYILGKY